MKNWTRLFTLLFPLLFVIGCRSKNTNSIDKTKIYPDLYVKLDATKGDTAKLLTLLAETHPILGHNDNFVSMIYHKLGVAFYNERNDKKALEYYKQSLEIRQSIFAPIHVDIAKSHLNIAKVSNNLFDHIEAVNHAKRATEISQKIQPIDAFELGDAYLTLAESQTFIGELSGAVDN